jgi:hypothetical protein
LPVDRYDNRDERQISSSLINRESNSFPHAHLSNGYVSYPETWITGESQMEQTADLSAALAFVIDRIEQQAMRSGEPLNEDERFLLNNLPTVSTAPEINIGDPEVPLHFVRRDRTYERLCALAKAARRNDVQLNPASLDWDFAFAVAKLSQHPLSWLLQWAGVKQRRAWWDRWLLIVVALLVIGAGVPLMLLATDRPWSLWRWTIVVAGYTGILLFMYFPSQRIERQQLRRNVENCRSASRFVSTLAR